MPMSYQATKEFRQELGMEKGAGVRFQYRVDRDIIRDDGTEAKIESRFLNSTVQSTPLPCLFRAGTAIDFFGHCHDT